MSAVTTGTGTGDGLAFMDESSHIADTTFPLGDKNDTLGFGIGRRTFDPGEGNFSATNAPLNANVLRLFGSSSLGVLEQVYQMEPFPGAYLRRQAPLDALARGAAAATHALRARTGRM